MNKTILVCLMASLAVGLQPSNVTKTVFTATEAITSTISNTLVPSSTASITASQTTYITETETMSSTASAVLPTQPAVITLVSAVTIPMNCIAPEVDTSETLKCRKILFSIENDGFEFNSNRMTFSVQHGVMRPIPLPGSLELPFGLVAQWKDVGLAADVDSNVTHLTVTLPINHGLDIVTPSKIEFNFTSGDVTLRKQPVAPPYTIVITLSARERIEIPRAPIAIQAIAGTLGALSIVFPHDSPLIDAQLNVAFGISKCTQPIARFVSDLGKRMLFPSAEVDDPLYMSLLHNIIIALIFSAVHLLLVYVVMLRYRCSFADAAPIVHWPSISFAVIAAGQTGSTVAALGSLFGVGVPVGWRLLGLLATIAVIVITILPIRLLLRFHDATSRPHDYSLYEFPAVLRVMMPNSSWGPDWKSNGWKVPYGLTEKSRRPWATVHYAFAMGQVFLVSVVPRDPRGCAAQFFFTIMLCLVYVAVLIRMMPFRSRFAVVTGVLQALCTLLPLFASLIHSFTPTSDTSVMVANLFLLCQCLVILRCFCLAAVIFFEKYVLREKTWPEGMEIFLGTLKQQENDQPQNVVVPETDQSAAVQSNSRPMVVELQELQQGWQREVTEHAAKTEMTEDQRAEFLYFDPQDLPTSEARESPTFKKPKAKRIRQPRHEMTRHPIQVLLRRDGPIPPELHRSLAKDYDQL